MSIIRCIKHESDITAARCLETQRSSRIGGRITDAECAICPPGKKVRATWNNLIKQKMEDVMATPLNKQCKAEGCTKYRISSGLCTTHYKEITGESYKPKNKHKKAKTPATSLADIKDKHVSKAPAPVKEPAPSYIVALPIPTVHEHHQISIADALAPYVKRFGACAVVETVMVAFMKDAPNPAVRA